MSGSKWAFGSTGSDEPVRCWAFCLALGGALLGGCAGPRPPGSYQIRGQTYVPLASAEGFSEIGLASWYGADFHGRPTASGETYDMYARTAAHKLLPLGTTIRVTDLATNVAVTARVNDRGPFVEGRIVDLSYALARDLDLIRRGTGRVRVVAIRGPGGVPAPGPVLPGPFAWQVGAFGVEANARALARDLEADFGTALVSVVDRSETVLHRVRLGRYTTVAEAEEVYSRLAARGLRPFLVRADPEVTP